MFIMHQHFPHTSCIIKCPGELLKWNLSDPQNKHTQQPEAAHTQLNPALNTEAAIH